MTMPRPHCHLTPEDCAIFARWSLVLEAQYRNADEWDAVLAFARLRTSGSVVESVVIDIEAENLAERRRAMAAQAMRPAPDLVAELKAAFRQRVVREAV